MARLKTLVVSPLLLGRLNTEGSEIHVRCVKGLPAGAVMVNSFYDWIHSCLCLTYQHESWPDVLEGQMISRFTPELEEASLEVKWEEVGHARLP